MKRSTERILTTHTGSLPRPDNLVQLMVAKEQGKPVDAVELADSVRNAVADVVKHQVAVGIDIISDGEMSKIGFANYVKDRLTGFEGESNPFIAQDVLDHPDLRVRMFRRTEGSESRYFTPACTGPITLRDKDAVHRDIANLKAALQESQPTDVFMPAASPGTIAQVMLNNYYPTQEAYLYASRTPCATNTKPSLRQASCYSWIVQTWPCSDIFVLLMPASMNFAGRCSKT